jgi:hypothetical protein
MVLDVIIADADKYGLVQLTDNQLSKPERDSCRPDLALKSKIKI